MSPGLILAVTLLLDVDPERPSRVTLRAPDAQVGSEIAVYATSEPQEEVPSGPGVFGLSEWGGSGEGLRFTPSFDLTRGATYLAVLRKENRVLKTLSWQVPPPSSSPPRLLRVHPTAEVVPANLLKFYLEFDQPMREGRIIFDRIHLETDSGERVHSPWRRQELWNEDATRLTLWIHPGRIKRGVNLRAQLGPVLHPHRNYALVVDGTVSNQAGQPMGQTVRHPFRTTEEDHLRPDPSQWKLELPQAGTKAPLRVTAPEPLDHALIRRHVSIHRDGSPVETPSVRLLPGDTRWEMIPAQPWQDGPHQLEIGSWLEDLAGNTPERVFDTDLTQPEPSPLPQTIPFSPQPRS